MPESIYLKNFRKATTPYLKGSLASEGGREGLRDEKI